MQNDIYQGFRYQNLNICNFNMHQLFLIEFSIEKLVNVKMEFVK